MAPMTDEEKKHAREEREQQKIISQWRTVICAMVGVVVLAATFWVLIYYVTRIPSATAKDGAVVFGAAIGLTQPFVDLFGKLVDGTKYLIGFVAAKAAWEHAAKNKGLWGTVKNALGLADKKSPAATTPPAGA